MKRCVKCAEKIQNAASVCRYCSAVQPKAPSSWPLILICVGVIGVLAILGNLSNKGNSAEKTRPAEDRSASAAKGPSPLQVEIMSLRKLELALKDPDSMATRNVRVPNGAGYACGEVNSRNSFGGMTGFKRFVAGAGSSMPVAIDGENMDNTEFEGAWAKLCA